MMMILASRSMFFRSRNVIVPFVLSMTLTFQGHDLCKSHFLAHISVTNGQNLAKF